VGEDTFVIGGETAPALDGEVGKAVTQKPLSHRASDYVETGLVPVVDAPDGGKLIGGGEPPEAALGLSDDNLVCLEAPGRPQCGHYIAYLTEADGYTKGVVEQPKQIRRLCRALATKTELMEIGEVAIFACTAREPQDLVSINRIRAFEQRQKAVAAEQNQTSHEETL